MICTKKHEEGVECPDCQALARVWEKLDDFPVPDVSPDFDARLYARITAEDDAEEAAETSRPWWYRLLWPPVAPVAIAAVAAVVLFVHAPGTPDGSKQASTTDIEQVAQAVDDLDLLIPIAR